VERGQVKDLRSFLADVKRLHPEELVTVEREVDLRFEISALHVKLDRSQVSIALFASCATSASPARFRCCRIFRQPGCALALESSVAKSPGLRRAQPGA
jgi:3-polyprenyl-4-hydroxybenzoate decarboxylase